MTRVQTGNPPGGSGAFAGRSRRGSPSASATWHWGKIRASPVLQIPESSCGQSFSIGFSVSTMLMPLAAISTRFRDDVASLT